MDALRKPVDFELRPLIFFQNKNSFLGSKGKLRFKIVPEGELLHLYTWTSDLCFEKSQVDGPEDFPLTEEGLDALRDRLFELHKALPPEPEDFGFYF